MFSHLWNLIKGVIDSMIGPTTIESSLHITPLMSTKMTDAMELWNHMYKDEAPWLKEATVADPVGIHSLGLPSLIASEKARMATLELKSKITVPNEDSSYESDEEFDSDTGVGLGTPNGKLKQKFESSAKKEGQSRAKFLDDAYQREIIGKIRTQLEYGIAKGGLVIKPYLTWTPKIDDDGNIVKGEDIPSLSVEYIQADSFFPISFNSSGKITEAVFVQTKQQENIIYRRLEYHKLIGTKIVVKNKAYKTTLSSNQDNMDYSASIDLGTEVPLDTIEEWSTLEPEAEITNVDRLLFGYFKMPEANNIDPMSPLGISGFARAAKLIEQADIQYSRLLWEFEATEAAIDVDVNALVERNDGAGGHHTSRPILQERLFRQIDLGTDDTYKVFTPTIRDHSIVNGLNQILMRIEDVCALSRGTLSEVTSEARTATELKILKQRSYSANAEIQHALEETLKDVVYIMNVYCTLYDITEDGQYDVSFEWDDSILVDIDMELSKRLTLLQNGLASKVETRMWYFGETETQARDALAVIDEENRQAIIDNMEFQKMLGGQDETMAEDGTTPEDVVAGAQQGEQVQAEEASLADIEAPEAEEAKLTQVDEQLEEV